MLEVDGSHGEGGGQVLRTAVALSSLTGTPVRVVDIRARRRKPGLMAQHIAAVSAVAKLSRARVEGLEVGSTSLTFTPEEPRGGSFRFDVGTAGSVTLVMQACLPVMLRVGRAEVVVTGGTDVPFSPPLDYAGHVFLASLGRLGGRVRLEVATRGYYPRGGGRMRIAVDEPAAWRPVDLSEPPRIESISGRFHASNLPEHVVDRMRTGALHKLEGFRDVHVRTETLGPERAVGPGGAAVLWAHAGGAVLGATCLAEKGKRAEAVGAEAADRLREEIKSGATADVHAADQLLPYLAQAPGPSTFLVREVTPHADTVMWLLRTFLGTRFEVAPVDGAVRVVVLPA